jgi:DNA polymerase-3 subunit chi
MTNIVFYIIEATNNTERLRLACRLLEKAYKTRHRVYVNANDEKQAHLLDEMLWTYRDDTFLPHNLYGDGPEPAPPIQIGVGVTPDKQRDILLNLSQTIPDFFPQFARVLEIVSADADIQATGREHFRHYRAAGHEITTHKLSTVE